MINAMNTLKNKEIKKSLDKKLNSVFVKLFLIKIIQEITIAEKYINQILLVKNAPRHTENKTRIYNLLLLISLYLS